MSDLVLVTGASGYVASHVVQQLVAKGYPVRGTVRSLRNEEKIKPVRDLGDGGSLELVEADLTNDESWLKAAQGCTYVMHIASPFPLQNPRDENELIKPAVDGTLSVLRACRAAKSVKRVVLTSSIASVAGNKGVSKKEPYTEEDWTDPENCINAYYKSKVLAEKSAWEFVENLPSEEKFELAVINPGLVIGPALCGGTGTSVDFMRQLLNREMPALPNIIFPLVDVRDVAAAHIEAMTNMQAAGHRHILCCTSLWFKEISQILVAEFKSQGYNPPTLTAPKPLLWLYARFDKNAKTALQLIGQEVQADNTRMTQVLNIQPIDVKESILDMAYNMIESGKAKKTAKYKPRQPGTTSM